MTRGLLGHGGRHGGGQGVEAAPLAPRSWDPYKSIVLYNLTLH